MGAFVLLLLQVPFAAKELSLYAPLTAGSQDGEQRMGACDMAAAEAMLARDKLQSGLRESSARLERRREGTLRARDLSFCDS